MFLQHVAAPINWWIAGPCLGMFAVITGFLACSALASRMRDSRNLQTPSQRRLAETARRLKAYFGLERPLQYCPDPREERRAITQLLQQCAGDNIPLLWDIAHDHGFVKSELPPIVTELTDRERFYRLRQAINEALDDLNQQEELRLRDRSAGAA